VTGWIASALRRWAAPVLMVSGGVVREVEGPKAPGNFASDPNPEWLVYEVDESDGSLVSFTPDYGIVLNVGTDHHERPKLPVAFSVSSSPSPGGASSSIAALDGALCLPPSVRGGLVRDSGDRPLAGGDCCPHGLRLWGGGYQLSPWRVWVGSVRGSLGGISAANAAAVLACCACCLWRVPASRLVSALAAFGGIRQRLSWWATGTAVFPSTVTTRTTSRKSEPRFRPSTRSVPDRPSQCSQPHGYSPFGFMRQALKDVLGKALRPGDEFIFLPVYYAGGTTSFSPQADEVAREYRAAGLPVRCAPHRSDVECLLRENACHTRASWSWGAGSFSAGVDTDPGDGRGRRLRLVWEATTGGQQGHIPGYKGRQTPEH